MHLGMGTEGQAVAGTCDDPTPAPTWYANMKNAKAELAMASSSPSLLGCLICCTMLGRAASSVSPAHARTRTWSATTCSTRRGRSHSRPTPTPP